ncbi:HEPN domain-containing protein, partial [Novosphingobium sp. ST904]|uniref:HEPN domain-containing protein n=1 Tax=Novosphingobium sp. ST904 TaxID=1684385 RepID=UPI00104F7F35
FLFFELANSLVLSTQEWKRQGRILKVILFGAYARGTGTRELPGGRTPKYSILVVVSDDRLAQKSDFPLHAEDRLMREHAITRQLAVPISLSIRGIKSVHRDLSHGKSFVCGAVADGTVLYELPGHPLSLPMVPDHAAVLQERRADFDYWFSSASEFLEFAQISLARKWLNRAVFQFHQATEVLYHTVLYMLTGDSPRSQNVTWLRDRSEDIVPALARAWPSETKSEKRCFKRLHDSYVKSRYDRQYRISEDELAWIAGRVDYLHSEVQALSCDRLGVDFMVRGET